MGRVSHPKEITFEDNSNKNVGDLKTDSWDDSILASEQVAEDHRSVDQSYLSSTILEIDQDKLEAIKQKLSEMHSSSISTTDDPVSIKVMNIATRKPWANLVEHQDADISDALRIMNVETVRILG